MKKHADNMLIIKIVFVFLQRFYAKIILLNNLIFKWIKFLFVPSERIGSFACPEILLFRVYIDTYLLPYISTAYIKLLFFADT